MTYSCTDFVDTILDALNIKVPDEDSDNPSAQADLALAAIDKLRTNATMFAKMAQYLDAVQIACPENASRDRYGRLNGPRNGDPLRKLAIEFKIANGGQDTLDQAAMIARKMLEQVHGA